MILEFHPAAVQEAREARDWYREKSPVIQRAFDEELHKAFRQIIDHPRLWPPFEQGTRRVLLRTFPYSIVYRQNARGVQIIAVMHSKRRPGYWKAREDPR